MMTLNSGKLFSENNSQEEQPGMARNQYGGRSGPSYRLSVGTYARSMLNRRRLIILAIGATCLYLVWHAAGVQDGAEDHLQIGLRSDGNNERIQDVDVSKAKQVLNKTAALMDFQQRKTLYEQTCQGRQPGGVGSLFIHLPSALAVCHIPKVGCTFWKRLFKFLYKDYDGKANIKTMFDMDRYYVHFGPSKTLESYSYRDEGKKLADSAVKVMFARDPYQRLWSGYVDKFLLPDSWGDHGRAIMYSRKGKKSACSDDVQFEEFLEYTMRNRDAHWRPIHEVCDPCAFKPDIVGHMETFSRDVEYILEDRGLSYLTEGHNHSSHVEDEIRILVDYHYNLYKDRRSVKDCLTVGQLAARLWRVLQLNGYFSLDLPYPKAEVEARLIVQGGDPMLVKDEVINIFTAKFRENPTTSTDWRRQRNIVINQAYGNISKDLLHKIQDRFKTDFALFGYDSKPPGS